MLKNLEVVEVDEPISTSVQQEEYVSSILQKDDTIPVLLEDSSSVPHNVEVVYLSFYKFVFLLIDCTSYLQI